MPDRNMKTPPAHGAAVEPVALDGAKTDPTTMGVSGPVAESHEHGEVDLGVDAEAGISEYYSPFEKFAFDAMDARILREAIAELDKVEGPRLGDFVKFQDGSINRISVNRHRNEVQTTQHGSFFLGKGGFMEFSGACGAPIARERLTPLSETLEGDVWTFHHGYVVAGGRVDGKVPFRVYAYTGD